MRAPAFLQSPNYHQFTGRPIELIVVHATGAAKLASTKSWFMDPLSKRSSHVVIDKDGSRVQFVEYKDVAWHAGISRWGDLPPKPGTSLNFYSIGLELVNLNTGDDPYPAAQLATLTSIVRDLRVRFSIKKINIVRHLDVSGPSVREPKDVKTDPAGFPWAKWKEML